MNGKFSLRDLTLLAHPSNYSIIEDRTFIGGTMEQRSTQHQLDKQKKNDWFLRFIKGMFIGSGFILPGVSGGALAAIFGLYERMILTW